MICGAALTFDPAAETALRAAWQRLAQAGLPDLMTRLDYPPHLTLFLADGLDLPGLRAAAERLTAAQPLPVTFSSLGVFAGETSVVFLAPTPARALLDLHTRCWAALSPFTRGVPDHYHPGAWTPHVTLGIDVPGDRLADALEMLNPLPIRQALITGIIFGTFNPGGVSQLDRVSFTA